MRRLRVLLALLAVGGEAKRRGLVSGVEQGMVRSLRDAGVTTVTDLFWEFASVEELADFTFKRGGRLQSVGKRAPVIRRMAQAMQTGTELLLAKPVIPPSPNYAMFDLEGLPPHLDELEKIYLWGIKVYGARPSPYLAATADIGSGGDRAGWFAFLNLAQLVFEEYGDISFVHWHYYERTKINLYIDRYGNPEGVAARVLANLHDLVGCAPASQLQPQSRGEAHRVQTHAGRVRRGLGHGQVHRGH